VNYAYALVCDGLTNLLGSHADLLTDPHKLLHSLFQQACVFFVKILGVSALCQWGLTIATVSLTRNTGAHSIVSECERVFSGVERKK
jgi:hypothetical protein